MFFFRIMIMSLRSLWVHPLRSVLATLGVIIGVAAVVAAMAILEGMSARFATGFESMGSNKLYIMPAVQRRGHRTVGVFDSLKLADADAILKECDAIRTAIHDRYRFEGLNVRQTMSDRHARTLGQHSAFRVEIF